MLHCLIRWKSYWIKRKADRARGKNHRPRIFYGQMSLVIEEADQAANQAADDQNRCSCYGCGADGGRTSYGPGPDGTDGTGGCCPRRDA